MIATLCTAVFAFAAGAAAASLADSAIKWRAAWRRLNAEAERLEHQGDDA